MNSDALPLVSVIIPVFNTEKYIEDCIFSVINQNYSRLEIIIVNDGSTDGSRSIIQKYMEVDRRIVCIDKKNEGLPLARKTGILKANGKYIQHLDSDDTLIDGAIEKYVGQKKLMLILLHLLSFFVIRTRGLFFQSLIHSVRFQESVILGRN